jgi:hypothetical protein
MTSDGIVETDWNRVRKLAVAIANESDDSKELSLRLRLRSLLSELRMQYGDLPSILATEADYADSPKESEALLLRAYELAGAMADRCNLREISLSLASLYVDQMPDPVEARRWLAASRGLLDDEESRHEYRSIARALRRYRNEHPEPART